MNYRVATPLDVLYERLSLLGKVLSAVCCLWIAVVGTVLIRDLTPNDLENHRAPVIQARVGLCEGDFARRYACASTILVSGEHHGASALLVRLGVTLFLPTVAWVMWRGVMTRAEKLRGLSHPDWGWPAPVPHK